MATIYDIDFNKMVVQLLPPDKRYTLQKKWVQALFSPLAYLWNKLFIDYKKGAIYPVWVTGNVYGYLQKVIYGPSVYESIVDGNTDTPTNTATWRVYQLDFTGTDQQLKYNGQKLVLEYAINYRFKTMFRQPPLIPDIYISTLPVFTSVFRVGASDQESSLVYFDRSTEFIQDEYEFDITPQMQVHVPIAVYEGVSVDPTARESIFRTYIDKYLPVGIIYEIVTY